MKWLLPVIALLLIGDVGALVTIDRDVTPSTWDPRVAKLASFVEDERHLRFDHPVEVRFLTNDEYAKESSSDEGELSDEDKQDIAQVEGEMRALGLLDKDASLFEDTNTITTGGTLAFYDPDTEEMVIKGTELTVGLRVTIVHELTHALQDQHFDLGRDFESDNKAALFHALGEGDASRIENRYVDSLSEDDQNEYYDEQDAASDEAESAIEDVSPFISQLFGAPYALGEPLTTVVVETKGVGELNKLFRNPPASDELLVSPFALLDGEKPKTVAVPKARAGEKIGHEGDFGALTWYLMLSARIDEKAALAATDGWGGDSYIGYRKGGRSCVRAVFLGDTPQDTQEMTSALNQWKTAFGSPSVVVTPSADRVELESCEPENAPPPRAGSEEALLLPIVRYQLVNEVLSSGGSAKLARCATNEFLSRLTVKQLNPQTEAEFNKVQQLGVQVGQLCARRGEI